MEQSRWQTSLSLYVHLYYEHAFFVCCGISQFSKSFTLRTDFLTFGVLGSIVYAILFFFSSRFKAALQCIYMQRQYMFARNNNSLNSSTSSNPQHNGKFMPSNCMRPCKVRLWFCMLSYLGTCSARNTGTSFLDSARFTESSFDSHIFCKNRDFSKT